MTPSNIEIILPVAGILLGIALGLISGISKEEKAKYAAISAFGIIVAAFTGISFYSYGYSLDVLLVFLICSCVGLIASFLFGLRYRGRKDRPRKPKILHA